MPHAIQFQKENNANMCAPPQQQQIMNANGQLYTVQNMTNMGGQPFIIPNGIVPNGFNFGK